MAALSISNIADAEHALSAPLNSAEAIYRANLEMKGFHQEVVRVVLLDTQHRCITKLDVAKGTVNESLANPREILRPAIIHSASRVCTCTHLCVASHRLCVVNSYVIGRSPPCVFKGFQVCPGDLTTSH